jgi:hypothetical protein
MEKIVKTIKIPKAEIKEYNRLLDIEEVDFEKEGVDEDTTLETYTFKFTKEIEGDIKICSGQNNLYIDPVLFYKGCECCVLDPEFEIDGEYSFEYDNVEYVGIIESK